MIVDASGNIYLPRGLAGILKVTSAGAVSPWSTGVIFDLTLSNSGDGFGAGGGQCHCIYRVQSNGTYSTFHQDTFDWSRITLGADSVLYAMVWGIDGYGLYTIDELSGDPTVVIAGGPAAGTGNGVYYSMESGADGKLYVLGSLDGTRSGQRMFRLDGSQLTIVANPPHGGGALALGPNGLFYISTGYDPGTGNPIGEIWIVDPSDGASSLLATSSPFIGQLHPTFGALHFDPNTATLYVMEEYKLWAIKKDPTPAIRNSWGAIKAQYRR